MKSKYNYKNLEKGIDNFIKSASKSKQEREKHIRNFIEKMAIWYELRYPDSEVTKEFEPNTVSKNISFQVFENNPYITDILKNSITEIDLKWEAFYNYDIFYKSLSEEEKALIDKPCYPSLLYLYREGVAHVHLTSDGKVEMYEYGIRNDGSIIYATDEFKNYNIREFIELLEKEGRPLHSNSEVFSAIKSYDNQNELRYNILNCVMYRIILRSDKKIAFRRAFLFAKEFDMNIELFLNYGLDNNDYSLLISISEYFKSIGRDDIVEDKVFAKHLKLTNLY